MAKEFCGICGKKITFGESPYSGVFKDGEACEACRGRLNSLLETKSVWFSPDLLASRSWKSFDRIGMKKMTVAQAQERLRTELHAVKRFLRYSVQTMTALVLCSTVFAWENIFRICSFSAQ